MATKVGMLPDPDEEYTLEALEGCLGCPFDKKAFDLLEEDGEVEGAPVLTYLQLKGIAVRLTLAQTPCSFGDERSSFRPLRHRQGISKKAARGYTVALWVDGYSFDTVSRLSVEDLQKKYGFKELHAQNARAAALQEAEGGEVCCVACHVTTTVLNPRVNTRAMTFHHDRRSPRNPRRRVLRMANHQRRYRSWSSRNPRAPTMQLSILASLEEHARSAARTCIRARSASQMPMATISTCTVTTSSLTRRCGTTKPGGISS